jgi:hypothetical protein
MPGENSLWSGAWGAYPQSKFEEQHWPENMVENN